MSGTDKALRTAMLACALALLAVLVLPATARAAAHRPLTEVGSLRITKVVDDRGRDMRSAKGGAVSVTLYATLSGTIADVGALKEGDVIDIPYGTKAGSHYQAFGWGGDSRLNGANGQRAFNVTYDYGRILLTRTSTPFVGSFDFSLVVHSTSWRGYESRESLFGTTSTITFADQSFSFSNEPIKIERQTSYDVLQGRQTTYNRQNGVLLEVNSFFYKSCGEALRTGKAAGPTAPHIVTMEITSTTPANPITGVTLARFLTRANVAYDANTLGMGADDIIVGNAARKDMSSTVRAHVAAEVATLRPGQFAISHVGDVWYVSANLGAAQGADIVPMVRDGHTWSTETNAVLDKLKALGMAPPRVSANPLVAFKTGDEAGAVRVSWTSTTGQSGTFVAKNRLAGNEGASQAGLSYDGNGATSGSVASAYGTPGSKVAAAENGFERPGFSFVGWNTKKDGSGTHVRPGGEVTLPAEGKVTVLYAQWEAASFTLVAACVDEDGGPLKTVEKGRAIRLGDAWDIQAPQIEGYRYRGLAEGSDPLKGSVGEQNLRDHAITMVYQRLHGVTARVVDEQGTELKAVWTVAEGLVRGESWEVTRPSVAGYQFLRVHEESAPERGTVAADTPTAQEVVLVYRPLASAVPQAGGPPPAVVPARGACLAAAGVAYARLRRR